MAELRYRQFAELETGYVWQLPTEPETAKLKRALEVLKKWKNQLSNAKQNCPS